MNVLIASPLLFVIAFFLHLLIWRFRIPENPAKTILMVFFFVLVVGVLLLRYAPLESSIVESISLANLGECLHVSLVFMAFLSTYYFVYGALEDESPSMFTIMSVANASENGLSERDLNELITDELFIKPRMDYLVEEQMVCLQDGKYRLATKGKNFISLIKFFQTIMKLSMKAG